MNLESHYDLVTDFIISYLRFSRKTLTEGSLYIFSKGFKKGLRFLRLSMKGSKPRNRLSIKNAPPELRNLFRELMPKKIVDNPLFKIWSEEWPLAALVKELRVLYPDADFEKLYKIHQLREAKILSEQPSIKNTIGLIFAACTITLQIIPKELIDKIEMIDYGTFKIATFLITLGIVLYFLILLLPIWLSRKKMVNVYYEVGYILNYASISMGEIKSNIANSADAKTGAAD